VDGEMTGMTGQHMDCASAQELLLDADDGAVPAKAEGAVAAACEHVETCAACRAALADLRRYRQVLRQFDVSTTPAAEDWDAFADRLVGAIGRRRMENETICSAGVARRGAGGAAPLKFASPAVRRGWVPWGFAAAAAACVLTGTVGFWAGRQRGGSMPPTPVILAGLSDQDTDFATRAFAAMWDKRADSRVSWAVVRGDAADTEFESDDAGAGVSIADTTGASGGRLWVLRLTAMRDNQVVSVVDLGILPGRMAKLSVNLDDAAGGKLRYLIATDPGPVPRATVWTDFKAIEGGVTGIVGGDVVLKSGEPVSAGRLAAPGGGYDVKIAFADAAFRPNAESDHPSTLPVPGKGTL
jgi:hypothetical protein